MVGSDQVRTFTLSGDDLELTSSPVLFDGKMRTGHNVFRRANAAGDLPARSAESH